jgi:hypothetical protein
MTRRFRIRDGVLVLLRRQQFHVRLPVVQPLMSRGIVELKMYFEMGLSSEVLTIVQWGVHLSATATTLNLNFYPRVL